MVELDVGALVQQLVEPLRREVALLQQMLQRERQVQRELTGRLVAPVDTVFDLLQESATTMERQAAALEAAGAALAETAALMRTQAQLFERSVTTLHQPIRLMKLAAGVGDEDGAAPAADGDAPAQATTTRRRRS